MQTSSVAPPWASRFSGSVAVTTRPPAQLAVNTPSASESRFSIRRPRSREKSSAAAPSIPISSSAVNTHSSGGCGSASSSSSASSIAAAAPLSAPRVLPSAQTVSPSVASRGPSCRMSRSQPCSTSQTMSMWPCRMTGAALS